MIHIPRIFHRIWLGEQPMPNEFQRYGKTWTDRHPAWEMKTWTDANRIELLNEALFNAEPTWAGQSDLLRFEILLRFGGVYIDTDFECLQNIEPLIQDALCFAGWESEEYIATGIFGATANHPFIERVVAELPRRHRPGRKNVSANSGPLFLHNLLQDSELRSALVAIQRQAFYPKKDDEREIATAYAIHHGAGSWVQPGAFDEDSKAIDGELDKTWGSHVPLLATLQQHVPHATVIECGVGNQSTPLLLARCRSYVGIEHNASWAGIMQSRFAADKRFTIVTAPLCVGVMTARAAMQPNQVEAIEEVYDTILPELPQICDLLFVDTFSGVRLTALEKLHRRAETIVLHDTEPPHFEGYAYDRFLPLAKDRRRYSYRPEGWPHSDVITRFDLDCLAFVQELRRRSEDFFGCTFSCEGLWVRRS
jgi:hypothetical protein